MAWRRWPCTVPSGCPVPVPVPAPAGMAPAGPLAGAVGRARLPHAAQPSLPESPRAGEGSAAWENQLGTACLPQGCTLQLGKRGQEHPKAATPERAQGVPRVSSWGFLWGSCHSCGTPRGWCRGAGCVYSTAGDEVSPRLSCFTALQPSHPRFQLLSIQGKGWKGGCSLPGCP